MEKKKMEEKTIKTSPKCIRWSTREKISTEDILHKNDDHIEEEKIDKTKETGLRNLKSLSFLFSSDTINNDLLKAKSSIISGRTLAFQSFFLEKSQTMKENFCLKQTHLLESEDRDEKEEKTLFKEKDDEIEEKEIEQMMDCDQSYLVGEEYGIEIKNVKMRHRIRRREQTNSIQVDLSDHVAENLQLEIKEPLVSQEDIAEIRHTVWKPKGEFIKPLWERNLGYHRAWDVGKKGCMALKTSGEWDSILAPKKVRFFIMDGTDPDLFLTIYTNSDLQLARGLSSEKLGSIIASDLAKGEWNEHKGKVIFRRSDKKNKITCIQNISPEFFEAMIICLWEMECHKAIQQCYYNRRREMRRTELFTEKKTGAKKSVNLNELKRNNASVVAFKNVIDLNCSIASYSLNHNNNYISTSNRKFVNKVNLPSPSYTRFISNNFGVSKIKESTSKLSKNFSRRKCIEKKTTEIINKLHDKDNENCDSSTLFSCPSQIQSDTDNRENSSIKNISAFEALDKKEGKSVLSDTSTDFDSQFLSIRFIDKSKDSKINFKKKIDEYYYDTKVMENLQDSPYYFNKNDDSELLRKACF